MILLQAIFLEIMASFTESIYVTITKNIRKFLNILAITKSIVANKTTLNVLKLNILLLLVMKSSNIVFI